jgi:hypothetical protein
MIFLNNEAVAKDAKKIEELKSVFPLFFDKGTKYRPVTLRNNEGFFYKAKTGRVGGTMKLVDRPTAGVRITMRTRFYDDEFKMNEIVVSSSPPIKDVRGNVKFGKKDGLTLSHGCMITDLDQLYYLYFYYGNISNNAVLEKAPRPQFSFVMPEQEQGARISKAMQDAKMVTSIIEGLSDSSVEDILKKIGGSVSVDSMTNRDSLLVAYNGTKKEQVIGLVSAIEVISNEVGDTIKVDVQAVVTSALESGKIKIEDGKLFVRKKDGEFSLKAEKSLTGDEDEQFLEVVSYFDTNEAKLKLIQ